MSHRPPALSRATGTLAALLALVALALPARADEAQVRSALDMAPADPAVVVLIPSLSRLNQEVARLNDRLALNVPQMTDIVGELARMSGMVNGVRREGPMLMVVPEADLEGGPPAALLVVPVDDYEAFVGNFEGDATAAVTQVAIPGGRTGYVRSVDRFAVMGDREDRVRGYEPARAAGDLLRAAGSLADDYLKGASLAAILNVQVMRPALETGLAMALTQARMKAGAAPGAGAAGMAAATKLYEDALGVVVRDAQMMMLAVELNDLGPMLTGSVQMTPGSKLAELFGEGGGAPAHLTRLPARPWLAAASFDAAGMNLSGLVEQAVAAMPAGEDAFLRDMIESALPIAALTHGGATTYYVPEQGALMGGGMITGVTVIEAENGEAMLEANQHYIEKLGETKMSLGPMPGPDGQVDPNSPPTEISFNTQYTRGVLRVEGVRVDQYQVQPVLPPQMMQQVGPMMLVMGGTGQAGYLAALPNHAVMTTTTDAQLIKVALGAARENDGLGAGGIIPRARQAALPPNLIAESYVNIAGLAQMVDQLISVMAPGQVPPLEAPADMQPISMGVGAQDDGLTARLFLPTTVIRFVSDTVRELAPMAGGAGGGGDPPRHGPNGPGAGTPPF